MTLLRFLPWIGWPIAIAFALLWLNARDAIIEERGACNIATVQNALDIANAQLLAMRTEYERQLQNTQRLRDMEAEARERAEAVALTAVQRADAVSRMITELAKDTDDEKVNCLNEFVPAAIVDSLREGKNCSSAVSGGNGSDQTCLSPARLDADETVSSDTTGSIDLF